jgi:hypothetical protein
MGGMPTELPPLPSPIDLSGSGLEEEIDPELVALPAPARGERTFAVALLVFAGAAALAMAFALRRDVAYALSSRTAVSVGDLASANDATLSAYENRFVRGEAVLGVAGAVRYTRPWVAGAFRTLPVAGRTDIWVDLRVPAGQDDRRWEPPRELAGRLVRFGGTGPRHRGLARAIEEMAHVVVPSNAWLLVDGEDPESGHNGMVLAAAFLGFAVWNAAALARILGKIH